jgi:hypothetical protein
MYIIMSLDCIIRLISFLRNQMPLSNQDIKSSLNLAEIDVNDIFDFLPKGNSFYDEERRSAAFANGLSSNFVVNHVSPVEPTMVLKSSLGVKRPAPKKFISAKRAKMLTMVTSSLTVSFDPIQQHQESVEHPPTPQGSGRTGPYFDYGTILESLMLRVNFGESSTSELQ